MRLLPALVLALILAACGGSGTTDPGDEGQSACEQAVADAAVVDSMQDTVGDLDAAIEACESLAEFTAASDQFPDALDGVDPATFIANRCQSGEVAASLCDETETGPIEGAVEPAIPGFNGQTLLDALTAQGFACEGPVEFTTELSQWDCRAEASDAPRVFYEVVILGKSLDQIHSIDAGVDQAAAQPADPALSAGFMAFIAETVAFEGADPAAAAAWVADNAAAEEAEQTVGNVLYFLRGPDFLRGLQIVAQD